MKFIIVVAFVAVGTLGLVGCGCAFPDACGGARGGSTEPTPTPSSPPQSTVLVVDPLVRIHMTWECNPCFPDPDNYAFYVKGGTPSWLYVANPLLPQGTLTWIGRLAPGQHEVEVVANWLNGPATVTFSWYGDGVTGGFGGVKPDSVKVLWFGGRPAASSTINRCGTVELYRDKGSLDSVLGFEVVLEPHESVC